MKVLVVQSCTTLCDPMNCSPWGFSRQEYWNGLPCPPSGDLPNLGIEPRSPTLQADSLPSEPPGKPKNIGAGSLSFLQWIFQPRNWTGVSCVAGGFFTSWDTREVQTHSVLHWLGKEPQLPKWKARILPLNLKDLLKWTLWSLSWNVLSLIVITRVYQNGDCTLVNHQMQGIYHGRWERSSRLYYCIEGQEVLIRVKSQLLGWLPTPVEVENMKNDFIKLKKDY